MFRHNLIFCNIIYNSSEKYEVYLKYSQIIIKTECKVRAFYVSLQGINKNSDKRKDNIMKKIGFLMILSSLLFTACKSDFVGEQTPSEVALSVFNGLITGDTAAIKRNIYITDEIQRATFNDYFRIAAASSQYMETTANYKPVYNIVSETIDGNDAEVVLTTKNISGQNVRITVKLLVDEGRWKVDGDHGVWH